MEEKISEIISSAQKIVLIQADNPDGDSLASSLALEQILGGQGKEVLMYCGTEIPGYLKHMVGWDRVQSEMPANFDASIIVDTSAVVLLEQLQKSGELGWLKTKPCIVLDHHIATEPTIDFATVAYIQDAVSTGEIIYELSGKLGWGRNDAANKLLAISILSDSLGLTSEGTGPRSIHIIAELVEQGVKLPEIENNRRAMNKKSPEILKYKGRLLERVEYSEDNRIAMITIPWEEIELFSHEYNPSILVLDEMRQVNGVAIAIAFKTYPDGRITAKLRANYGFSIAAELASRFGGGGHPYASGFKVTGGKPFNEVKSECIAAALELLDTLNETRGKENETAQYAYTVD